MLTTFSLWTDVDKQRSRVRERAFHKHWDIAGRPEALSTRVYGLVQRLDLSIPGLSLSSWSIPSCPYLLELHFICSRSLLIYHLFSQRRWSCFFICPALPNSLPPCPYFSPPLPRLPSPSTLAVFPVFVSFPEPSLFFSLLLVISSLLSDLPCYLSASSHTF